VTGENRFRRAMHVRDALRRGEFSNHTWTAGTYKGRHVMVCQLCGYVWKPDMAQPAKDCRRSAPLAQDAQQGGQGDHTDLDQQHDGLGVVHADGSTLSDEEET